MNKQWIVVSDPTNDYLPGSLIDENKVRQLNSRGVTCLPVQTQLFKMSGVGGYAKREYGSGWPLDNLTPRMNCPLTMYCIRDFTAVHWAARITATEELLEKIRGGMKLQGQFRLSSDSGQATPLHIGLSSDQKPIDVNALGMPDANGGWNIGGQSKMEVALAGHYGFALYGAAPGLRVLWVAISLAAE